MWEIRSTLATAASAMRYSSFKELKPHCETALRILEIMFECTAKIEATTKDEERKQEVARLTQLFRGAKIEIRTILNLCKSRPLQTRFFLHTYGSRLSTAFHNVDNAWLLWIRAQPVNATADLSPFCVRIGAAQRELAIRIKPDEIDRHFEKAYGEMIREAKLFGDCGVDSHDAANFLSKTKEAAFIADLATDDDDWMRQMLLVTESRDELRESIAAAKSAAGKDVADDEEFLRAMVDAENDNDVHAEPEDALARQQLERDELRQQLESEQVLFNTICATIRLVQPMRERTVAFLPPIVAPRMTPTSRTAPSPAADPSPTPPPQPPMNMGRNPTSLQLRLEADRLDSETARLVAETARLELEHHDGGRHATLERDRFTARKQLYDQALNAQRHAKLKIDARRKGAVSYIAVDSESSAESASQDDDSVHRTTDATILASLLSNQPCDNAKRARAASRIADLCGLDDGAAEREHRDTIRRTGGVSALVGMLNVHCKQPELDQFGRALWALACYNEDNRACMIEDGVLPIVVARVADHNCDNRYLTPLWRTLDAESPSQYARGLVQSGDTLVESLLLIVRSSYNAEEQLLAARAVLILLYADDSMSTRNWRLLVLGQGGLKALANVLERRLEQPNDEKVDELAGAAKAVAADTLFNLVSPLALRMRGDLLTIEGASNTIASFNSLDDEANPDMSQAVLALVRYLFDHLATVAQTANSPLLTAAAIKGIVIQLVKAAEATSTSTEGGLSSWFIKEQAAKALRKLILHTEKNSSLSAPEIVEMIANEGAIIPLVDLLRLEVDGSSQKSVLLAKQEAARLLRILAESNRTNVSAIVSRGAIPSLVRLIDAINKDDPKEAAVTALWALCKDSRQHRNMVVNSPRGIKTLMQLVARTATNASDEASCRLLYHIANDDANNEQFIRMQRDVMGDMMRTLEWNVQYGDTIHVKGAAKLLRDKLKANLATSKQKSVTVERQKSPSFLGIFCRPKRKKKSSKKSHRK